MRRVWALGVLGAGLVGCVDHVDPPLKITEALWEGTVGEAIADDFEHHTSERMLVFHDDLTERSYPLHLDDALEGPLRSGTRVQFTGSLEPDEGLLVARVATLERLAPPPPAPSHRAAVTERTLVIPVEIGTTGLSLGSGCSLSDIEDSYLDAADSVMEYFNDVSEGAVDFSGDLSDTLTISKPSSSCDFYTISARADAAYKAKYGSSSFSGYNRRVYIMPSKGCGWAGLGEVAAPGYTTRAWVVDTWACSEGIVTHELGHNLGMGHASTSTAEYGDHSDPMGNSALMLDFNGPHLDEMGWLDSSQIEDATAGTYTLASLDSTDTTSTKMLRFAGSSGHTYTVAYRTDEEWSADLGSTYADGLSIHRTPYKTTNTLLLDVLGTSDTYTPTDTKVPAITFTSASGGYAVVEVAGSSGGSSSSASDPVGLFKKAGKLYSKGWTYDPDSLTTTLQVEIRVDGTTALTLDADRRYSGWRKAFPSAGSQHGFKGKHGKQSKGTHTLEAWALDVDSSGTPTGDAFLLTPTWTVTVR